MINIFFIFLFLFASITTFAEGTDNMSAEAHLKLGRTYLLQGNEVKASKEFDKAVSIDEEFKEKVVSEYYDAGLVLIKNPKTSNVGLHYLNKFVRNKKDKGIEVASVLYIEGVNLIGTKRFMANAILKRALELNPSYEKDENFFFACHIKSAYKSDDVIKGGEEFLKMFPDSGHVAEALFLMGEASLELHKPQQARDYFKRVKDNFPDTEWGTKTAKRL